MTTNELSVAPHRPWLGHYPPGISWDAPIDLTPVTDRVLAACQRYPQNIAFDFLGASTRYAELERKIKQLSVALQAELGVKKGTRVAMLLPNTPYYVYFYYAVLRAGGIVVNCNPLYTVPELAHIVNDSEAEILVTLDLKQVFDKAEKLGALTGLQRIIVCPFPKALPPLKNLLFSIAKRGDIASVKSSAVADKIVPYERLLKTERKFSPVPIDPEKDVCRAAIYRRHHRHAQGGDAQPRQYRGQHELRSPIGVARSIRPTRSSLPSCPSSTSSP